MRYDGKFLLFVLKEKENPNPQHLLKTLSTLTKADQAQWDQIMVEEDISFGSYLHNAGLLPAL